MDDEDLDQGSQLMCSHFISALMSLKLVSNKAIRSFTPQKYRLFLMPGEQN